MKKYILFSFILIITSVCRAQYWTTPSDIREIAIPTLNDIAVASYDQYGPVIYYNPYVVKQVGPLVSAFFHAHEYGHHYLGHVIDQIFNAENPYVQLWLTLYAENAADAYSVQSHVRLGNKAVLQATYNRFVYFPTSGDKTHPSSVQRAQNIATIYFQLTGTTLFP